MSDAERRFTSVPVEIRVGSGGNGKHQTIGGYAAKFNRMSQNLGGFKEQIAAGAFNRSASQGWPDVQARYNHEDGQLLGTIGGNSLRLHTDTEGLMYDVDLLDIEDHRKVYALVERGDIRQSSFAFIADEDEWGADDTGFPMRTLHQVRLLDVAPVNAPAYLDTSVGLRSLAAKFDADIEEVRTMAAHNELTRFFKRTDDQGKPLGRPLDARAAYAQSLALDPNVSL
jgi:HK97 family phage prohead protease